MTKCTPKIIVTAVVSPIAVFLLLLCLSEIKNSFNTWLDNRIFASRATTFTNARIDSVMAVVAATNKHVDISTSFRTGYSTIYAVGE